MVMIPNFLTISAAICNVGLMPTMSSTTSAPRPSVISQTAGFHRQFSAYPAKGNRNTVRNGRCQIWGRTGYSGIGTSLGLSRWLSAGQAFRAGQSGQQRRQWQTDFILVYTFFHKISLLEVIIAMRSFQELTNDFSPSS